MGPGLTQYAQAFRTGVPDHEDHRDIGTVSILESTDGSKHRMARLQPTPFGIDEAAIASRVQLRRYYHQVWISEHQCLPLRSHPGSQSISASSLLILSDLHTVSSVLDNELSRYLVC